MADKVGAYGTKASEGSFRKKWDTEAYAAKAKEQDAVHAEHAKESEAAIKAGKKPPTRHRSGPDLPKPTKSLEARTEDLGIDKNLNKTVLVSGGSKAGPGFFCEICKRTLKDSIAYLDHVNGRSHLARLGQTTQVRRSTLEQVRDKIASLRNSTHQKVTSKNYDFEARLKSIREEEEKKRLEKKEGKKRKREEMRLNNEERQRKGGVVLLGNDDDEGEGQQPQKRKGAFGNELKEVKRAEEEQSAMAEMMGFGGFGAPKKR